jgi:hypothetical protein
MARGPSAGPRPVGVTAASWCGPVPWVTRARPPAVAVFGLSGLARKFVEGQVQAVGSLR